VPTRCLRSIGGNLRTSAAKTARSAQSRRCRVGSAQHGEFVTQHQEFDILRPALFLIQLSNQTDTTILTKITEVTGLAPTFGAGGLAGLGVKVTMMAWVLL
jgi:hypothetical protein